MHRLSWPPACGILVPWPGIEPASFPLEAHRLNHWTARDVLVNLFNQYISVKGPWGGHGNSLQYSCLGNPKDRGAWRLQVIGSHRVRHDWSDLARLHTRWDKSIPERILNLLNQSLRTCCKEATLKTNQSMTVLHFQSQPLDSTHTLVNRILGLKSIHSYPVTDTKPCFHDCGN